MTFNPLLLMLLSTFLTLVYVPMFYALFDGLRNRLRHEAPVPDPALEHGVAP